MTEEQKRLLKFYSESNKTELKEESVEVVSLPTSVEESSSKVILDGPRDESNLTYEQLIEDYNQFNKSAVMKESTWNRLWNS